MGLFRKDFPWLSPIPRGYTPTIPIDPSLLFQKGGQLLPLALSCSLHILSETSRNHGMIGWENYGKNDIKGEELAYNIYIYRYIYIYTVYIVMHTYIHIME